MGWTLNIVPPQINSAPSRELTQAAAAGIDGGFKWQLAPNGDTLQMEFAGRNDRLLIQPRSTVFLKVNGLPAFFGVIPDPPSLKDRDSKPLLALGGREVLRVTLMDGVVYRNMGVYAIARDIFSRLCPPGLAYSASQIGDGTGTDAGPTLGLFYKPFQSLESVLDALAKSAGTTGGVDTVGRIFLGRPAAAAVNVGYTDQPWNRLQTQGRETVTQATLRIVSGTSGPEPTKRRTFTSGFYSDYLPATLVAVATDAVNDPIYHAQQSYDTPSGVSVLVDGTRTLGGQIQFGNPANAIDGDPATYAENLGRNANGFDTPLLGFRSAAGVRAIGVRVRYSVFNKQDKDILQMLVSQSGNLTNGNSVFDESVYDLTNDQYIREQTIIFPPSVSTNQRYKELTVLFQLYRQNYSSSTPSDDFQPGVLRVYDVTPLVIDETAAQRVAGGFLRSPFTTPAEVVLNGIYAPSPLLSVTGSPDGTVSGTPAVFEYEHSPENFLQTRVKLGATGQSQEARSIRFTARAEARDVGR